MSEVAPAERKTPEERGPIRLLLFFAGARTSPAPFRKTADELQAILGSAHTVQLVDISAEPEKAIEYHIIATPMMIKQSPGPERRVFGDLSNLAQVLNALELR